MNEPVILLNPEDNVVVCRRAVSAGERLTVAGKVVVALCDVDIGHKIACVPIAVGAAVVKYGMAIGSATTSIAAGDWVHVHNMRSNYIETHTRSPSGNES
jgi:D-threo-aldose 1-dehydrogenase